MKKFILIFILIVKVVYAVDNNIFSPLEGVTKHFGVKKTPVKVATYNMGMLSTDLASVPYYETRWENIEPALSDYLNKSKPSVLFLQEVWHGNPNFEILKVARKEGYYSVININNKIKNSIIFENSHGLQILLSKELIASAESYSGGFKPLDQVESYICGFGIICKRGYAYARLKIEGKVYIFATFHLTPLINEVNKRRTQIIEIIQRIESENADYIIVGADFNYSPVIGDLGIDRKNKNMLKVWEQNAELYYEWIKLWNNKGYDCRDNWNEVNPGMKGYTQDRENNAVAASGKATMSEPSQRIDQIWTCGKTLNAVEIKTAGLIFTEKKTGVENHHYEISDHYGVESTLNIYSVIKIYSSWRSCSFRIQKCALTGIKSRKMY